MLASFLGTILAIAVVCIYARLKPNSPKRLYISERIANMEDCEDKIRSALFLADRIGTILSEDVIDTATLQDHFDLLKDELEGIRDFNFEVDRRVTVYSYLP